MVWKRTGLVTISNLLPVIASKRLMRTQLKSQLSQLVQERLSPSEINEILYKSAAVIPKPHIHIASLEANQPIEDTFTVMSLSRSKPDEQQQKNESDGSLQGLMMGVFDGHWDAHCSHAVSQLLPKFMARELSHASAESSRASIPRTRIESALTTAFTDLDGALMDLPKTLFPGIEKMSFKDVEKNFAKLPESDLEAKMNQLVCAYTGSCALTSFVHDNQLYIANAGDSRAVLGRFTKDSDKLEAVEMSNDHTPDNPNELSRLRKEHPGEENSVASSQSPKRVLGGLMPSRAFGDAIYKLPIDLQAKINVALGGLYRGRNFETPKNCLTPPYVTAAPEIRVHPIDPERDACLILASDGVFDFLPSQKVIDTVHSFLQTSSILKRQSSKTEKKEDFFQADTNAGVAVIRAALSAGSGSDNITGMLSVSPPGARYVRDDMTVLVLFLPAAKQYIQ